MDPQTFVQQRCPWCLCGRKHYPKGERWPPCWSLTSAAAHRLPVSCTHMFSASGSPFYLFPQGFSRWHVFISLHGNPALHTQHKVSSFLSAMKPANGHRSHPAHFDVWAHPRPAVFRQARGSRAHLSALFLGLPTGKDRLPPPCSGTCSSLQKPLQEAASPRPCLPQRQDCKSASHHTAFVLLLGKYSGFPVQRPCPCCSQLSWGMNYKWLYWAILSFGPMLRSPMPFRIPRMYLCGHFLPFSLEELMTQSLLSVIQNCTLGAL